jgi:hypothetical protein
MTLIKKIAGIPQYFSCLVLPKSGGLLFKFFLQISVIRVDQW